MLRPGRAIRSLLAVVITTLALAVAAKTGARVAALAPRTHDPAITHITPNQGQPGQRDLSVEIVAAGSQFVPGVTIASFGPGITVTVTRVIDAHRLAAHLMIAADAALGQRTVVVTSGSETFSLSGGFTVRRLPAQSQPFAYAVGRRSDVQPVTIVDTSTNTIAGVLSAGVGCACLGAEGVAVARDGARVYVTNEASNSISVIDAAASTVAATIPLDPAGTGGPVAVAVSPDSTRLYVMMMTGTLKVIDTSSHAVLSSVPLVSHNSRGMAVTPDGRRLYVSNFDNLSVTVLDTAALSVLTYIPLGQLEPLGVDISADGAFVYVANTFSIVGPPVQGTVSIISTATNSVVGTVGVGVIPYSARVAPDGARAYAANLALPRGPGRVSVIDTATRTVIGSVAGSTGTYALAFTPDGSRAYLATGSSIAVADVASSAVVGNIPTPPAIHGAMLSIAMSPGATRAIALSGALDFGTVPLGASATRTLTITNTGNAALDVSGLIFPAGFTAAFAGATIPAGGSQQVVVTFAPAAAGAYGGIVSANGNQTLGAGTIAISGYGSSDTSRHGDFDRDGATDITVFRPSSGDWFVLKSGGGFGAADVYTLGATTDLPVAGDYDGDGRTDIAVYRPASGHWFIRTSASGYLETTTYQWGTTGDVPVAGDFDADGRSDLAIYRPSNGTWYVLLSGSGFTSGLGYQWGAAEDVPVPGDYDGDGRTDIAVYRPSSAHWFILQSASSYTAWVTYQWGTTGDVPVAGDYDGDGRRDIAIYRPSSGAWFVLLSSSGFIAGSGHAWGAAGDEPAPGDYDGDGRTDIAVFRGSSGHWFILRSSTGYSESWTYQWGTTGDVPVDRRW